MLIEYDAAKDAANLAKHGVSLALAADFEWDTACIEEDRRFEYDEQRFKATGYIGMRLYVLIYCLPDDDDDDETTRVISLRPAEPKECRDYAET